jgi:hypothetical protein
MFPSFFSDNELAELKRKQYFNFMKSTNAYEKQTFILRIKELEVLIKENRELYNMTRESDYVMRSQILREIDSIKISLSMLKNKHQLWKQHRTTISK